MIRFANISHFLKNNNEITEILNNYYNQWIVSSIKGHHNSIPWWERNSSNPSSKHLNSSFFPHYVFSKYSLPKYLEDPENFDSLEDACGLEAWRDRKDYFDKFPGKEEKAFRATDAIIWVHESWKDTSAKGAWNAEIDNTNYYSYSKSWHQYFNKYIWMKFNTILVELLNKEINTSSHFSNIIQLDEIVSAELTTQQPITYKKYNNIDSFMGWHTNCNNPGHRMYLVYNTHDNSSCMRFIDNKTEKVITKWEPKGWTLNYFYISDCEDPLWHSIYTKKERYSLGFKILGTSSPKNWGVHD